MLSEDNLRTKYSDALALTSWAYREGASFDQDINIALEYILYAIAIDPDYLGNYYEISYIYIEKEQYDKALEYINIGIEKSPNDELMSNLYNLKGISYYYSNNDAEAKAAFEKALEYDPDNIYASDNLDDFFN